MNTSTPDVLNQELVTLLQDLVRIPSWVSDNAEQPQNENALVLFLEKWFSDHTDFSVEKQELPGGRYNLIVKKGDPFTVFLAHTDTVQPSKNAQYDQLAAEIREGKMYGRGTTDMKSGIAAMIQALQITECKNIWMFLYADEEYDFLGMKELIAKYSDIRPKVIISSDGSDLQIGHGCRGLIEFRGKFIGATGHPAKGTGKSAIEHGFAALNQLKNEITNITHPVMGSSSFNISYVLGGAQQNSQEGGRLQSVGQAGNVVPDVLEFVLDIRPASPDLRLDTVIEKLMNISKQLEISFQVVERTHDLGAWYTDSDRLTPYLNCANRVLGTTVKLDKPSESGYIDLQMLWDKTERPLAFMFGGGVGLTAHTPDEYIEIENLIKTRDFFVSVLNEVTP